MVKVLYIDEIRVQLSKIIFEEIEQDNRARSNLGEQALEWTIFSIRLSKQGN